MDCHGHGLCYNGTCFCRPGFSGTSCSKVVKVKENRAAEHCAGRCVQHCLQICKETEPNNAIGCVKDCQPKCLRHCIFVSHHRSGTKTPIGQQAQEAKTNSKAADDAALANATVAVAAMRFKEVMAGTPSAAALLKAARDV
eukprot:g348.t1